MLGRNREIPVYLFTGFLESGKTSFIDESLRSDEFNKEGERTLLLLCEEGIEEYDLYHYPNKDVFIEEIDDINLLNPVYLDNLENKWNPSRVIIEYNGMWMLDRLYAAMPPSWVVYQEMTFAYAPTYLTYNQNMRNLVFDKLQSAEMVIFNRFSRAFDKMEFHKIVRVANRRSQIIYEYERDEVEFDDIEDPLPFDFDADVVEIADIDYAYWYRDINEEAEKYDGKKVRFKGRTLTGGQLPEGSMVIGRHVMTCCIEDVQFAGLIAVWDQAEIDKVVHGDWATVLVEVKFEYHEAYKEEGPVLYIKEFTPCEPLEDDIATF
ncbi:MAG: hypothetical protein MJ145_04655 [Clostridia bacterium]|nr:hypothetical protein [Clostridia bacterium]